MKNTVRSALSLFLLLTLLTGVVYPFGVTLLAQTMFPFQAGGSIIEKDGKAVGSALIGQSFADPGHFWSRPSATAPVAYNAAASVGSNLGPTNQALIDTVKGRVAALHDSDPGNTLPIPVDLVTASGSGLDPEISLAAAQWQVPRIARERNVSEESLHALIEENANRGSLPLFDSPRVNVLKLNLALNTLP